MIRSLEKDTKRTLLHIACSNSECEKIVTILVKKAAESEKNLTVDVSKQGFTKTKSRKYSSKNRNSTFIDFVDYEGNTAIHLATINGFTNSVIHLRDQGANCGLINEKGDLPIYCAAVRGDFHAFWNLKEQTPLKSMQKDIQKIMIAAINSSCDEIVENLADDFNMNSSLKKSSGTLTISRKSTASPVVEAFKKGNLKVSKLLMDFGFWITKDQLQNVLSELMFKNDASEFFDLLYQNGTIDKDCKIGKEFLMKIILNDENILDRSRLLDVSVKHNFTCRANMLENLVRYPTLLGTEILTKIFNGYDSYEIQLDSTFKSATENIQGTLFEFALTAKNEQAALLINQYSAKSPSEKTARTCILNNLPKVLDVILGSGLSSDVKFSDGDMGLHKAINLPTMDVMQTININHKPWLSIN